MKRRDWELAGIVAYIAVALTVAGAVGYTHALTRPDHIQPLRSPATACSEFISAGYVRQTDYRWCISKLEDMAPRHWNSWAMGYFA